MKQNEIDTICSGKLGLPGLHIFFSLHLFKCLLSWASVFTLARAILL